MEEKNYLEMFEKLVNEEKTSEKRLDEIEEWICTKSDLQCTCHIAPPCDRCITMPNELM